jgi:hypothetical protein
MVVDSISGKLSNKRIMKKVMTRAGGLLVAVMILGCGGSDFNDGKVKSLIESQPVRLEGEQVILTQQQVDCGVQADLWDPPTQLSPERSTARLTQKGRDLKFSDDVIVKDPEYKQPYAQVRGDLPLQVADVTRIGDADSSGNRLVDAKAGVKMENACFQAPLPLMGIKNGKFVQGPPVSFRFQMDNGWKLDRLVH